MTWNHRVWKEMVYGKDSSGKDDCVRYTIRETYYNKAGEVTACSDQPQPLASFLELRYEDSTEELCLKSLAFDLKSMTRAMEFPVLDLDSIVWGKWDE